MNLPTQTDRQTDTDSQTHRRRHTNTHTYTKTHRHRHTDSQTHRLTRTDIQTHTHTDTLTVAPPADGQCVHVQRPEVHQTVDITPSHRAK